MFTATTASALEWKWKLKCIDFPGQVISWAKIRNLKTKRLPGPRGTVLLGYRSWWSRSRIPSASYKECRNSFFYIYNIQKQLMLVSPSYAGRAHMAFTFLLCMCYLHVTLGSFLFYALVRCCTLMELMTDLSWIHVLVTLGTKFWAGALLLGNGRETLHRQSSVPVLLSLEPVVIAVGSILSFFRVFSLFFNSRCFYYMRGCVQFQYVEIDEARCPGIGSVYFILFHLWPVQCFME